MALVGSGLGEVMVFEFIYYDYYRKWRIMAKEIWKDVKGYNDLYEVSNLGVIRNKLTKHQLSVKVDKWGYAIVRLADNGTSKQCRAHRIVAITFLDNPLKKPEVNHVDCNKLNNSVENLEWVTGEENRKHAIKNGLMVCKSIVGTSKATGERTVFNSIGEAIRKTKEPEPSVYSCLRGTQRSTRNYYWSLA